MIKLFRIRKSALVAFLISLLFTFVMAVSAHAQDVSKYNISFPIGELGGCKDYAACRTFCEDPVNATSCISFAKQKGFYKEETDSQKQAVLEKAKQTLGCDSIESCKTFCQIPENHDKCDSFAKSQNISGGKVEDPAKKEIIEKAKQTLGCDSPESCATFCSDAANRQKCSDFAKEVGLKGGERPVGPGGCSSEASCKAFCSDPNNYSVCSGFALANGGQFKGPGGCDSPQSCKSYCEKNPGGCAAQGGPGGGSSPSEMCNKTPNCAWNGNTCQCGNLNTSGQQRDPAKECARYSGCSFVNNSCQCGTRYEGSPGSTPQPSSTPSSGTSGGYNSTAPCPNTFCSQQGYAPDPSASCACKPVPTPGNYSGTYSSSAESGCKSAGGTWMGNYCKMPEGAPYSGNVDVASQGCQNAGGTWMGNYCQMPSSGNSGGTQVQYQGNMSRESQEAGCRACNGSCNWSGDFCNCQCGSTGSTTSQPAYSQSSYTQSTEPQPTQTTTQPAPQPSSQVQGVSAVRSFFQHILDYLK